MGAKNGTKYSPSENQPKFELPQDLVTTIWSPV